MVTAAPPGKQGGVVIVIGRSWLALFLSLLILEVLADDEAVLLVGRPIEATRALAASIVRDGAGRVILSDQLLTPGDERLVMQLLWGRCARLVVSASDHPEEQQLARSLSQLLDARVVGASCGGPGWVGPGVPSFSGSANQRPAMAMRLARALAAEASAALREDDEAEA